MVLEVWEAQQPTPNLEEVEAVEHTDRGVRVVLDQRVVQQGHQQQLTQAGVVEVVAQDLVNRLVVLVVKVFAL
jgi:hypothetical protein